MAWAFSQFLFFFFLPQSFLSLSLSSQCFLWGICICKMCYSFWIVWTVWILLVLRFLLSWLSIHPDGKPHMGVGMPTLHPMVYVSGDLHIKTIFGCEFPALSRVQDILCLLGRVIYPRLVSVPFVWRFVWVYKLLFVYMYIIGSKVTYV